MAHKAMDVYLNDHLGGATMGSNLAGQIAEHAEGTALADVMTRLEADIEADRETLLTLMERMDVTRNPVKQATGWLAETASRVKFSGAASGDRDHAIFLALETMALGVLGKLSLWRALREVRAARVIQYAEASKAAAGDGGRRGGIARGYSTARQTTVASSLSSSRHASSAARWTLRTVSAAEPSSESSAASATPS
jgi:hypothetical protein